MCSSRLCETPSWFNPFSFQLVTFYPEAQGTRPSRPGALSLHWCTSGPSVTVVDTLSLPFSLSTSAHKGARPTLLILKLKVHLGGEGRGEGNVAAVHRCHGLTGQSAGIWSPRTLTTVMLPRSKLSAFCCTAVLQS